MKKFMDEDFLLTTPTAVTLFHKYAKDMPIFDYHCHLSAKAIYENKPFKDIAEMWLGGDHYKWRAMRANGIPEAKITGSNSSGWEKFEAYAESLDYAVGNPLYHWSHLELQRYFGIDEVLGKKSAKSVWDKANATVAKGGFTPQELIKRSNVFALCTTEDPIDDLSYHHKLAETGFPVKVFPAFRPDKAMAVEKSEYAEYVKKLESVSGIKIDSYAKLTEALNKQMDVFTAAGCVASDHGVESIPFILSTPDEINNIFKMAMVGKQLSDIDVEKFKTAIMIFLGKQYAKRNWAMEIHTGALRNTNTPMFKQLGADTGYDTVVDHKVARPLAFLLNELEKDVGCPKTILFSLNEADNYVMSTMTGNFQSSPVPGKIQMGTAWWLQDHRDGMVDQMRSLANVGLLGRFIGMLTDSRSFLSYPRHEYFRRIMCDLIGSWVEAGEFPADMELLERLVKGISFENAKKYLLG